MTSTTSCLSRLLKNRQLHNMLSLELDSRNACSLHTSRNPNKKLVSSSMLRKLMALHWKQSLLRNFIHLQVIRPVKECTLFLLKSGKCKEIRHILTGVLQVTNIEDSISILSQISSLLLVSPASVLRMLTWTSTWTFIWSTIFSIFMMESSSQFHFQRGKFLSQKNFLSLKRRPFWWVCINW